MLNGVLKAAAVYLDPRMVVLFCLGFSSGLPLLLVYSTLTFWLLEAGLTLATVGLFAITSAPYSLKFLWAPALDRLPIPWLSAALGQRRSWLLITQLALVGAILMLANSDPGSAPTATIILALLVSFFSASQDIVVDAYRVERLELKEQGAGAAAAVFGYRIAMLTAGAGALYVAAYLDSWPLTYVVMAACMGVGVITTLVCAEPETPAHKEGTSTEQFRDAVVGPFLNILKRRGWVIFLAFVLLYKLGEVLGGAMTNPFLVELGFTNAEIANVAQTYGLIASIVGIFIGGYLVRLFGVIPVLWIGGILQMASNFIYIYQARVGHDVSALVTTIGIDNLSGGLGTAALVAYLSGLCDKSYTATQYAWLTALAALSGSTLAMGTGSLAAHVGWESFFAITAFAAVPGLLLLWWMTSRQSTGLPE